MNVTIDLMNACPDIALPAPEDFRLWTEAALHAAAGKGNKRLADTLELSIRIVDETESAELNATWRHKQGPTNILSFPCEDIPGTGFNLLGDLAICAPLVQKEAAQQHKPVRAHWAHLTVHGVLHLNGFDHEEPAAAERMEALEIGILDTLGFDNPYEQGNE